MLVNINNLSVSYVNKPLFDNCSFVVNDTDKIGIIGSNGVGKSTLLKVIAGKLETYTGEISYKKDIKIGYLAQAEDFNDEKTIYEEALRLTGLKEDFIIKANLNKFDLLDSSKKIKELSGGEKKRLALAICLSKPSDILLLDEPTNHLDVWMISYLEKFLMKWNKGLLLVTHDRYFLERITNKILDIDKHSVKLYDGAYSTYLSLKSAYLDTLAARERKLSAIYKKEAIWAGLNPQARSTKSTERLERFKDLEEDLNELHQLNLEKQDFTLQSNGTRLGKKTLILDNVSYMLNDKFLFNSFSYNVPRYDRLGIIGKNGCGKTTLFKVMAKLIEPSSGTVTIGETVKIGYFNQAGITIEKDMKTIDYIKDFGEYIDTPTGRLSASQLLDEYEFSDNLKYSYISTLSGGEKRRLQLVSILIQNPNILLLDEPTNDLDIYTLEVLEDYLESFKGAVIVVSHDRYFLDKVCDHLFVFDNGNLIPYNGIVSDYMNEFTPSSEKTIKTGKKDFTNVPRFTSKEKKEYDALPKEIDELSLEEDKLQEELKTITTDYERIIEINNKMDELDNIILEKMERFDELDKINQEIIKYRENKYKGV